MKSFVPQLVSTIPALPAYVEGRAAPPRRTDAGIRVVAVGELGERLGATWDALSARAGEPNVFARRWFLAPSLAHIAASNTGELVALMRGEAAIGLVPLARKRLYGPIPVSHLADWTHPNMFLAGATFARGEERAGWSALLASLAARGEHYALFGPLDRDGPVARGLVAAAAEAGLACRLVRQENRALLDSDLPSEAYWQAALPGKKRKELRRQERRLGELGALAFDWLERDADLPQWCDDFLALEQAGWKGREGSAMASDPATGRLFRDVLAGAQAARSLAMCRLTLDGRPIAMLVTLIAGRAGFSFKTTYDEALAAYSPGVLLQRYNLDLRSRAGLDWIDSCARPDHPMIDALWTQRRALAWYAVSLSGGVHRRAFDAVHALKALKRRLRGRPALRDTMGEECG
jgi:CelD/BcsL family acetyltransferase involved in cellulose biosynthesis